MRLSWQALEKVEHFLKNRYNSGVFLLNGESNVYKRS